MQSISIDDFIRDYLVILEKIKKGDSFLLMNKNKPLAELLPLSTKAKKWKQIIQPVQLLNETSLTDFIRQERDTI